MQAMFWRPWSIFDELERAMRLSAASSSEWPEFDVEDTEDETILTADLPGVTEDDLEVTVSAQMLTVRGTRKPSEKRQVRHRRFEGSFERHFRLGDGYDPDDVKANLAHGVLTIRLAKAAKAKPRRVKLSTGMVERVKGLLSGDKSGDKERHHAA